MTGDASPAIDARGLCKSYEICSMRATSLKEMAVRNFFSRGDRTTLPALKDVSFALRHGGSLGVIGGNGSGKSTLLKLITGIIPLDAGQLHVDGRVAALLELGAGFHPELTGMENVFLQGSILGMSRQTILGRLDRILDFCELGKFIHTPMKRYSSGMTVRLGFALAVFSDADILLIDEVLAVGDAAFQFKCLQKIADLRRHGRTIVLVSHIVEHIELVAEEILWLREGECQAFGRADDVLPAYIEALSGGTVRIAPREIRQGDMRHTARSVAAMPNLRVAPHGAAIEEVSFFDSGGGRTNAFREGEPIEVAVTFRTREPLAALSVHIAYTGAGDTRVAMHTSEFDGVTMHDLDGQYTARVRIGKPLFMLGRYMVSVVLGNPADRFEFYDGHVNAYMIQIRGEIRSEGSEAMHAPGRFLPLPP